MLSLGQARRGRGNAGEPLPTVFRAFDELGIVFRRGQTTLLVAGSGTGKSTLGLTIALRSGVPSLYLSPDSDEFVQISRSFSILAGVGQKRANRYALGNPDPLEDRLDGVPIRFAFDASPTLHDITRSMAAFEELYGEYPHLLLVDNVRDVHIDGGDGEEERITGFLTYAKTLTRETRACVIGMHHATGPFANGDKPIPLNGVKGQVHTIPEMVLTVFRADENTLGVSPVKNRGGARDSTGADVYARLSYDGDRSLITDEKG